MKEQKAWESPNSHGEILKKIWKHLDLGVIDRRHPFHTPVFATSTDGEANIRTVVLRRFWRKNPRGLAFHSHYGSPKIKEIQENPKVSWHFYNPQEQLQVKIKGIAEICTNGDLANEQWEATEFFSRRCYIGEAPTQISPKPTSGLPEDLTGRAPTKEESESGRANFAVIFSTINLIDCLELSSKGNRRSLFVWNEKGELETKWLTP